LDLSIDPTTKPTTIRGTMIGICGMESPLLDQHLGAFNKAVYHNCTQFFTKSICSKFPPETAHIATTRAGAPSTTCFLSLQIEQHPAFLEEFLGEFWERAKCGFRAFGNAAGPVSERNIMRPGVSDSESRKMKTR
jgi:hypothetical protein